MASASVRAFLPHGIGVLFGNHHGVLQVGVGRRGIARSIFPWSRPCFAETAIKINRLRRLDMIRKLQRDGLLPLQWRIRWRGFRFGRSGRGSIIRMHSGVI